MAEARAASPAPRKRGRPRTVTDDLQVPERRRKQLRVAQQAYRKRKETTITNLQSRVQELEAGIEELSQSFLSFSNILLEAELLEKHPRVTAALQKITQQCVALAKQGCDEPEQQTLANALVEIDRSKCETPATNLNPDTQIVQSGNLSFAEDLFPSPLNPLTQCSQLPPTPPIQDQPILPFGIVYSSPTPFSTIDSPLPSPPPIVSPNSLMNQEQRTVSHRLVRQCCQNGYWLLVNTPNNTSKITEIFGAPLSLNERNRMISSFYNTIYDEVGELVDQKAKVLNTLYNRRASFSPEALARTSRSWQIVTESEPGEYMDASGVQRYLQQRGINIMEDDSAHSSPSRDFTAGVNLSTFINYLSMRCICVGFGPAFKRKDVEKALYMALPRNQWQFESRC
ncbi:bZIP transcription factor bZIP-1 [Penicillium argentinense]|uniref:BZIP transcription factor bZIP-1 n=1 Tax=Penicillium argentinense TaxID=1131581 RepID=A0A9W9EXP0_9EURO|nr:bZIP transcription factor bZIP-1 [Penicillium argentinense]KAJ5089796.1 bZIP transcription factor bZIP-1 [Penicillium argentinense]